MAALAVVLLVPLAVGWLVERLAYGEARATDAVVAPLRDGVAGPAGKVRLAGVGTEPVAAEPRIEAHAGEIDAEPAAMLAGTPPR